MIFRINSHYFPVLTGSFCNGDALYLLWVRSQFLDFIRMNLGVCQKWKQKGKCSLKQTARRCRKQWTLHTRCFAFPFKTCLREIATVGWGGRGWDGERICALILGDSATWNTTPSETSLGSQLCTRSVKLRVDSEGWSSACTGNLWDRQTNYGETFLTQKWAVENGRWHRSPRSNNFVHCTARSLAIP
jgi:hypothetical protein